MPAEPAATAVLFDLDDTLVPFQTLAHWQWAWRPQGPLIPERHALAAIRESLRAWDRRRWQGAIGTLPPADAGDYRQHLRSTLTEIAGHALPPAEVEAVLDRFVRPTGEIERFPDAVATVAGLVGRGQKVGVATDLPKATAQELLKRSGLDPNLLVLSEDGSGSPRLPAGAAFRAAAEKLGRSPEATVYVADLYWSDVRASHRAGLRGVLIDRRSVWPRVGGPRLRTLSELPAVLEKGVSEPETSETPSADSSPGVT